MFKKIVLKNNKNLWKKGKFGFSGMHFRGKPRKNLKNWKKKENFAACSEITKVKKWTKKVDDKKIIFGSRLPIGLRQQSFMEKIVEKSIELSVWLKSI